MVDNSGLCSLKAWDEGSLRPERIRVAEVGSSRVGKNAQAGGSISANLRDADIGTRRRHKRLAASPASAFTE